MSARLAALYRLRDRVDAAIIAEGGRVRRRARLAPVAARPAPEPEPVEEEPEVRLSMAAIIAAAADHYSMSETMLRTGRTREVTDARLVCYLALRWEGYSAAGIGREFSRDHTSILSGCKRSNETPALRDAARAVIVAAENNFARTA